MKKVAIVGVGMQGSKYIRYFVDGKIRGAELAAIADVDLARMNTVDPEGKLLHFADYEDMFTSGIIDAVIINTPHYLHPIVSEAAVRNGIAVLSDKPLGVDVRSIHSLQTCLKDHPVTFGVLFNQRFDPIFDRIKEVIKSGRLGQLKRCVWEVTDWYRPQKYYDLGGWRSSWKGEGGGLLINQCVHNIDLIHYLFGKPEKIQSLVGYGVYHDTPVDDSVVANLIYKDSFLCTFISSTGETPGTNRFELSGTGGKLVLENFAKLEFQINEIDEATFSRTAVSAPNRIKFGKPKTHYYEEPVGEKKDLHLLCIQDFVDAVCNNKNPSATFEDGLACAEIVNGIYYADWIGTTVGIPVSEEKYYELLHARFE